MASRAPSKPRAQAPQSAQNPAVQKARHHQRAFEQADDDAGERLGPKTRELIALAVTATTRCDGCIAFHADLARKAVATKEDLAKALGVAIALNEGAALVYSARAMDAFQSPSAARRRPAPGMKPRRRPRVG